MDLVDESRGPGRPRLYDQRQYVCITAEQRRDLEALAEAAGGKIADEIRAAIDERAERLLRRTRTEVMSA